MAAQAQKGVNHLKTTQRKERYDRLKREAKQKLAKQKLGKEPYLRYSKSQRIGGNTAIAMIKLINEPETRSLTYSDVLVNYN